MGRCFGAGFAGANKKGAEKARPTGLVEFPAHFSHTHRYARRTAPICLAPKGTREYGAKKISALTVALDAVAVDLRNNVGSLPPLNALTVDAFRTSSLLSRYFLTGVQDSYQAKLAGFAEVTVSDIAFLWLCLRAPIDNVGYSFSRYTTALGFISAVCKGDDIVDHVHGTNDKFKEVDEESSSASSSSDEGSAKNGQGPLGRASTSSSSESSSEESEG